uniref:Large ribosomal subunit protein bL12 C-terminal domain-containing protein n=1 Tax=Trieres chinensis TaxID=1514140 RepID=A0A7S1ZK20_TRICV
MAHRIALAAAGRAAAVASVRSLPSAAASAAASPLRLAGAQRLLDLSSPPSSSSSSSRWEGRRRWFADGEAAAAEKKTDGGADDAPPDGGDSSSSSDEQRPEGEPPKGWSGGQVPPLPGITPAPLDHDKVERIFQKMLNLDMIQVHLVTCLLAEKMGMDVERTMNDLNSGKMSGGVGGGGGGGGGGGDGGGAEKEAEEEVRIAFDLKLTGFDAKAKIKVIKEVRSLTGLGLKEAKELVEGVPKIVMKEIKREEIEKMKEKLEAVGGQVEIV